jgi:hypothetical protein
MEIDPIKAKYFYENNDEKIKLNWFCYEYAFWLYDGIRKSIKLKKYRKQNDKEQIVKFCVFFSKEMKKSIFEKLGRLTDKTVFYEEYVTQYYPNQNKAINMFLLEVATKAWDGLLSDCEKCPTQCISKMYEKCVLFDRLDENEHLVEKYPEYPGLKKSIFQYTDAENISIENHIQRHFGNIDYFLQGKDDNNKDVLKIAIIKPNNEKNYWKLITIGIGAYRMNIPKEYIDVKNRIELIMCVEPDWNCSQNVYNTQDAWPIQILFKFAQILLEKKGIICRGLSIEFTSKGKIDFMGNTKYSSAMVIPCFLYDIDSDVCILPNKEIVDFACVFPLYQEEVEFYKSSTLDEMAKKFHKIFFKPVKPNRKNIVKENINE